MKKQILETDVLLEKIVIGGQAIGTLSSGKKVFAWGGLPGETVDVLLTKNKSSHAEGVVVMLKHKSQNRIEPKDKDSYLSTSPWQIIDYESEQQLKSHLIKEAFEQQHVKIEAPIIISDNHIYKYRNKMEYSFWWDEIEDTIKLAFFRRGSHNKVAVSGSSLPIPAISLAANKMLELINNIGVDSRSLKTMLIRSSQLNNVVIQLYVKDTRFVTITDDNFKNLSVSGLEIIYSNPKSPASVVTKRLQSFGNLQLKDDILGRTFSYSAEGFFQVNIPLYELALKEMQKLIDPKLPTIDMYCGVGTIGLSIGTNPLTMIESNPSAYSELELNIKNTDSGVKPLLQTSESALDVISREVNLILDPPRAGCHDKLIERIKDIKPSNVIYLSCNPITQARDIAKLVGEYEIKYVRGFNFFPRTPHIESLAILRRK